MKGSTWDPCKKGSTWDYHKIKDQIGIHENKKELINLGSIQMKNKRVSL
jgi:hypothetical protein